MTVPNRSNRQFVLAIILGAVVGCTLGAIVLSVFAAPLILQIAMGPTSTPTRPLPPTATRTNAPTATATVTTTPLPTLTRTATATRAAPANVTRIPTRQIAPHFMVGRPVPPNSAMISPSLSYLYGTTRRGDLDVHHGEEFENPVGTPLYAVADGTIVTAGGDAQPVCGDDGKTLCGRDMNGDPSGFYGKLVVLRLKSDYQGQRVFALYGHMNKVGVAVGDQVKSGDLLGEVGSSGIALGPHVHFEIRLGSNDYGSTRNPILWMTPLAGRGSVTGRYADPSGTPVRGAVLNIYRANGDFIFATETYGKDRWPEVNSDDVIGENFAIGDLAAGDYIVRVAGQQFASRFTIEAGKLTWVELGVPQ